jgi:hypothetical protein
MAITDGRFFQTHNGGVQRGIKTTASECLLMTETRLNDENQIFW